MEIGKERLALKGHSDLVVAVKALEDGKMFASWSKHEVKVWDIGTGVERITLNAALDTPEAVAVSPPCGSDPSGGLDGDGLRAILRASQGDPTSTPCITSL